MPVQACACWSRALTSNPKVASSHEPRQLNQHQPLDLLRLGHPAGCLIYMFSASSTGMSSNLGIAMHKGFKGMLAVLLRLDVGQFPLSIRVLLIAISEPTFLFPLSSKSLTLASPNCCFDLSTCSVGRHARLTGKTAKCFLQACETTDKRNESPTRHMDPNKAFGTSQ